MCDLNNENTTTCKVNEILAANEKKYIPRVRIGNWNEDNFKTESDICQYKLKRDKGELISQKFQKIFCNLLKEVEIERPGSFIKFGAIVQVIAPDLTGCGSEDKPLALSLGADENGFDVSQNITPNSEVTVAYSSRPCVRNTFIVSSPDKVDRSNQFLTYGQDFLLKSVDSSNGSLVLYSSPKTMSLSNAKCNTRIFYSPSGEINQSVGVCLQIDKFCSSLGYVSQVPSAHYRWRIMHFSRSFREETQGDPVPTNTRIIINNVASNRNLSAERVWFSTIFGSEMGVTATTYINQNKIELPQNIWMLATTQLPK